MIKIDFLICGRTAFNILKHHLETFGAQAIGQVVSYRDKKVLNDPYDELKDFCNHHSIQLHPKKEYKFRTAVFRIAIGWEWMVQAEGTTIVLHEGLLPRYRGFSPLVNSLINGEREIGVTAFVATTEYGAGPLIKQEKIMVDYPITILEAADLITPLYSSLCRNIYHQLNDTGKLTAYEQDHYLATYSLWRDKMSYVIDWNRSADYIKRLVDAVSYPYVGATSLLNGHSINIKAASIYGDVIIENRELGKVIFIKDNCPVVVCGEGLLKITDANYITSQQSIIPFVKFKSRFS